MACFISSVSSYASARSKRTTCCSTGQEAQSVPRRAFLKIAAAGLAGLALPRSEVGAAQNEVAIFAGGCFWCMEKPFDVLPGVISTTAGYCGGDQKNPTYEQVGRGRTGHAESMQVVYDPSKVTYEELLDVFWHNIDPTTLNREFCDTGKQYRTAVFYIGEAQRKLAVESKEKYEASDIFKKKIVTEISPAKVRFVASVKPSYAASYRLVGAGLMFLPITSFLPFFQRHFGRQRIITKTTIKNSHSCMHFTAQTVDETDTSKRYGVSLVHPFRSRIYPQRFSNV